MYVILLSEGKAFKNVTGFFHPHQKQMIYTFPCIFYFYEALLCVKRDTYLFINSKTKAKLFLFNTYNNNTIMSRQCDIVFTKTNCLKFDDVFSKILDI